MIRDLYTDTGEMTADGSSLDSIAVNFLRKLFHQEMMPHEVAAILHGAVEEARCETILTRRDKDYKARGKQRGTDKATPSPQ